MVRRDAGPHNFEDFDEFLLAFVASVVLKSPSFA
jgi:hypothetical protein